MRLLLALSRSSLSPGSRSAGDCVVLDDFSQGQAGRVSPRLEARARTPGAACYSGARGGRAAVPRRGIARRHRHPGGARSSRGTSTTYPMLAWSWRRRSSFRRLRTSGRVKHQRQRAVSVYAVFPHSSVSVKIARSTSGARWCRWARRLDLERRAHAGARAPQRTQRRSGQWVEERVERAARTTSSASEEADVPKPAGIARSHRRRRYEEPGRGATTPASRSASRDTVSGTVADPADPFETALCARRVTDGLPVVPPTARAGGGRGGRGRVDARRWAGRPRAAQLRSRHRGEDRDQRGDGGLPARIPAGGDRGGGGDVRRAPSICTASPPPPTCAAPLFIVNGPARKRLDINCGAGVFGPGRPRQRHHRPRPPTHRAQRRRSRRRQHLHVHAGPPGCFTYCIGGERGGEPLAAALGGARASRRGEA